MNEASFQKMKRRRGASSSFVLKPALTSTSTSAAIVRLYGYGFLIILMGQIFCKYCEGVNAASFGQRVELESTDANKNTHQVPVNELPAEVEEDFLVQSWFEPPIREIHREIDGKSPKQVLINGYGYNGDYGGPIDICKGPIVKDDEPESNNSTTATTESGDGDDEFFNSTPPPTPGEGIGTLPDGCHYVKGDLDVTYKNHLVCSDSNMDEIPMNIPSELDVFEMTATSVRCVRSRAFSNVHVQELNLKDNKIQYVADDAFEDVDGLQRLIMSNNNLQVPVWFHAHSGLETLRTIELEHNRICMTPFVLQNRESDDRLPTDFGVNGPYLTSIRDISLRSNSLEIIPPFFFARFRNTEVVWKIDLSACKLNYIDEDAFDAFATILLVDLSENPDLMGNLTSTAIGLANANINSLILSYNSLQRIPKEALMIMSETLRNLELQGNSLLQLADDSFPLMSTLTAINLDSCKLSKISRGAFANLPNLKVLSVRGNELTTVPLALGPLVNLRILRLCNNRDSRGTAFQIADKAFESLTRLEKLYMNNVLLNSLNASTFEGLTRLEFLSLQNSNVRALEDELFLHTPNLTKLDMRGNPLTGGISFNPSPRTNYGLQSLRTLILSGCGLSFPAVSEGEGENEPPKQPFRHLEALETLDLSNNQITQLYPELFGTLVNLQYLNLNRNKIQPWATQIFANNLNLDEVHLSENLLVTTAPCMISDFRLVRSTIDVTENPFGCDAGVCSLKSVVESGELQLQGWDESPASYRCYKTPQIRVPINSLTNEDCPVSSPGLPSSTELSLTPTTEQKDEEDPRNEEFESESTLTSSETSIIIIATCSLVVVACGVIAYQRRSDLKYFWFDIQLRLMARKEKHSESGLIRKKKTSDSEGYSVKAENFDYDVFISYSHHDSAFIQEDLVPVLEGKGKLLPIPNEDQLQRELQRQRDESGFRVCLHERDFEVGASITENIIECVDRSRKVLIIVSRNYLESQWCLFEMNLAYHRLVEVRRKSFLLILLEEIPAKERTKVLTYLMKSTTYLRWPGAEADANEKALFWARLRNGLALKPSPNT